MRLKPVARKSLSDAVFDQLSQEIVQGRMRPGTPLPSERSLCDMLRVNRGAVREAHYNPGWARFLVRRHPEFGVTQMSVSGEGRATEIGAFLNPDDRESFAEAFGQALAKAKRG